MSSYFQQTKHPVTGKWQLATWHDDYYGEHKYGVEFPPERMVYDPRKVELQTKDSAEIIGRVKPKE